MPYLCPNELLMFETWPALLFLIFFGIVFYAYVGYGLVMYVLLRLKKLFGYGRTLTLNDTYTPEIAFVVCAYNEEDWIEEKVANSIALDYPAEKVTFYFVSDGSDDATQQKLRDYPFPAAIQRVLMHEPERRGKIAAFQRAMDVITAPFVVSTDANTSLNRGALRNIIRHFQDERVGAVAGEKRISMEERANASSAGEGIYWKYESTLKRWDAELWTVVGAAGELFAFRRAAYAHVPMDTIVEDFYMTMRIAQKGYRVEYEPDAYAVEHSSASISEELKRKVRIAAGGLQAFVRLAPLLNPFRYGLLSFQYISHRVLRWTLAPLSLPLLLILNVKLAWDGHSFFKALLFFHLLFYLFAFVGYLMEQRHVKSKLFFVPYYFCVMNYAMYAGFFRLIRGRQSVLWERSKRAG